jgi:hypothetical protein
MQINMPFAQSMDLTILDHYNTATAGLIPNRGMDEYLCSVMIKSHLL